MNISLRSRGKELLSAFAYGKVGRSFYTENRQFLTHMNYNLIRIAYLTSALIACVLFFITCLSSRVAALRGFYLGVTALFTVMGVLVQTLVKERATLVRGMYYLFAAIVFGITIYVGAFRDPQTLE